MTSVLLLEDDADLRESLEIALQVAGVREVLSVARLKDLRALGEAALSCTSAVLDVNLGPRQPTGVEAAAWLRDNGFKGRIIFLTGHAGAYPQVREACERPNTVLAEKPASLGQIMKLIDEAGGG